MSMSSKHAAVMASIIIALLVGILVAREFAAARRAAKESAQRALLVEATQLLTEYHQEHGEYPDSLEGLAFTYPDGGDVSLLSQLEYVSDGKGYSLTTVGASTGEKLKVTSDDR